MPKSIVLPGFTCAENLSGGWYISAALSFILMYLAGLFCGQNETLYTTLSSLEEEWDKNQVNNEINIVNCHLK